MRTADVGTEGQAGLQLIAGLNIERVIIGAMFLGIAQRAFDETLAYVKERKQFGKPIGSFQALSQRLADLATELEKATRLLTYDVAQRVDENPAALLPKEASMVKLKATELAKVARLEGVQMMGGMGYSVESGMEELVRSLAGTIVGGTSEIQRDIIAKTLGL